MYGKMLVLTFEDNEDDMMSHILSLINTREEIIQMSGLNNHLLNFKGLKIDDSGKSGDRAYLYGI